MEPIWCSQEPFADMTIVFKRQRQHPVNNRYAQHLSKATPAFEHTQTRIRILFIVTDKNTRGKGRDIKVCAYMGMGIGEEYYSGCSYTSMYIVCVCILVQRE